MKFELQSGTTYFRYIEGDSEQESILSKIDGLKKLGFEIEYESEEDECEGTPYIIHRYWINEEQCVEIEVNSLEELLAFQQQVGCRIILHQYSPSDRELLKNVFEKQVSELPIIMLYN